MSPDACETVLPRPATVEPDLWCRHTRATVIPGHRNLERGMISVAATGRAGSAAYQRGCFQPEANDVLRETLVILGTQFPSPCYAMKIYRTVTSWSLEHVNVVDQRS